jgi:hypothetical protein
MLVKEEEAPADDAASPAEGEVKKAEDLPEKPGKEV